MRYLFTVWLAALVGVVSFGQVASPTHFGVIKVGANLSVDENGFLNAAAGGGGSANLTRTNVTATYTASGSDQVLEINTGATSTTLTLPAASGVTGKTYYVKRGDAAQTGKFTVAGASPVQALGGSFTTPVGHAGTLANQHINTNTWLVPTNWGSITYYSDGSNWKLLAYSQSNLKFNQTKLRVLVMGSSSANGAGAQVGAGGSATPPADRNGWLQQIATSLQATHDFIFCAVDGGAGPDMLATVEPLLQRYQPHFVVDALTLGNKWTSQTNVPLGADEFVDEYRKFAEIAGSYGATVLITTPHTRTDFTAQKYNFAGAVHRLCSLIDNVHVLGNGEFTFTESPGAYFGNAGDNIHFNFPLHAHMATQVPKFYFDTAPRSISSIMPAGNGTRITGASTVRPIELDYNYQSFCLTFDLKRESGAAASTIVASFSTTSNANLRLELDGSYNPRLIMDNGSGGNTVLVTSTTPITTTYQPVTVRYNAVQNTIALYQGSVKIGQSGSVGANWVMQKLILGGRASTATGNAVDYSYRNVQVQSTAPLDAVVLWMQKGNVYRGNLINVSYLSEEQNTFTGMRFVNATDYSPRFITNQ